MINIYRTSTRKLPVALTGSVEYKSSNDKEKHSLLTRACFIEEICLKIHNWTDSGEGYESTSDFIDSIELDIFAGISLNGKDEVSQWLLHSSWSKGAEINKMLMPFPGQYYDEESGQHYNYFRDYSPGIGR